jgi:hypothetical protein
VEREVKDSVEGRDYAGTSETDKRSASDHGTPGADVANVRISFASWFTSFINSTKSPGFHHYRFVFKCHTNSVGNRFQQVIIFSPTIDLSYKTLFRAQDLIVTLPFQA